VTLERLFRRWLRTLVSTFFRSVEVEGVENIPPEGGGILVSWHPNGMIDPALIFDRFPRRVVFGARHGLFSWPGLGAVLRALHTVPIFRADDSDGTNEEARREANARSLHALAEVVAQGSFACLFPEGDSHDAPHLMDLKTGAARFYFAALAQTPPGTPPPVLIPVGLFYDRKRVFRSNALVEFHPPITLPERLRSGPPKNATEEQERAFYRSVTDEIDAVLSDAIFATEDWKIHFLMRRSRKLARAERAARSGASPRPASMSERVLGFERVWRGYQARLKTHPAEVAALRAEIAEYDADLRALGIEDHELDRSPRLASRGLVAILALQVITVFVLFPPLLLFGYAVNGPSVLALWFLARRFASKKKDEATIKVLVGTLLFPLTWAFWGLLSFHAYESIRTYFPTMPDNAIGSSLLTVTLGILGGALALQYLRIARETLRAVRVRLTRRRSQACIARLREVRSLLCDALDRLSAGLELPGEVHEDGRIVRDSS
jgi:glycerol-3-phosphate O-acyltransferase/dihydroxyacetone phosphate acyltransferase